MDALEAKLEVLIRDFAVKLVAAIRSARIDEFSPRDARNAGFVVHRSRQHLTTERTMGTLLKIVTLAKKKNGVAAREIERALGVDAAEVKSALAAGLANKSLIKKKARYFSS
jgi:hypothetical protein